MTIFKCSVCGKEVKPDKPDRRRPYMVFYVNEPCVHCLGKVEMVKE